MQRIINGIPINYEEIGSGRTVLMLHGSPLDHHHMITDMEPMFDDRHGWRRLYIDIPGHGKTPGSDTIRNSDDLLNVLIAFMDEVAPKERFSVVGFSFGGYFARGFVHERGVSMDGIMLVVPKMTFDSAQEQVEEMQILHEDPAFLAAVDDEWVARMTVVQDIAIVTHMQVMNSTLVRADFDFLNSIKEPNFSFDVDTLDTPFPAPALVIAGRQDCIVGCRQQIALIGNYPRGTFVTLDRAGHLLGLEQKTLFRAFANDWLDRVEDYIVKRATTH